MLPTMSPTAEPSDSSSAGDAVGSFHGRRLNGVDVYMLDIDAHAYDDMTYTYSEEETPRLLAMEPTDVSVAITTNLTMVFENYGSNFEYDNITITVRGELCTHHNKTSDGVLSCRLNRRRDTPFINDVPVTVYFPNRGYAGVVGRMNEVPTVQQGFSLNNIYPNVGSVMGGSILTLTGFGFDEAHPSRHSVILKMFGLEPLSDYDRMLLALGFDIYSIRKPHEEITCDIVSVNFTQIRCTLASHFQVFPDLDYTVEIVLNDVAAECLDDGNCTYTQSLAETPVINSTLIDMTATPEGVYEFWLNVKVDERHVEHLSVWVGLNLTTIIQYEKILYDATWTPTEVPTFVPTTVSPTTMVPTAVPTAQPTLNNTNDTIHPSMLPTFRPTVRPTGTSAPSAGPTYSFDDKLAKNLFGYRLLVRTVPMALGTWNVTLNCHARGMAYSEARMFADTTIFDTDFSVHNGSVAGGTLMTITGRGFSSNCADNLVDVVMVHGPVQVTEFVNCTPNLISAYTPTVIQHYQAEFWNTVNWSPVMKVVEVFFRMERSSLAGTTSYIVHTTATFPLPSGRFQYSLIDTPRTTLNQTSGYAGDHVAIMLDTAYWQFGGHEFSNETLFYVTVGGIDAVCDGARSHHNTRRLLGTGEHNHMGEHCKTTEMTVPHLYARPEPYPVKIRIDPVGYAIFNGTNSMPTDLPQFTSLLQVDPFVHYVRTSFQGGMEIEVNGKGFSHNMSVNVCEQQCEIVSPLIDQDYDGVPVEMETMSPAPMVQHTHRRRLVAGMKDSNSDSDYSDSLVGRRLSASVGYGTRDHSTHEVDHSPDAWYSSVRCKIPARYSVAAVDELRANDVTIDLIDTVMGLVFKSGDSNVALALDNDYETYTSHSSTGCYYGVTVKPGYLSLPYRMRFYPRIRYSVDWWQSTVVYSGSTDGGSTYVQLGVTTPTSKQPVHEGWNFINVEPEHENTWFTHFKLSVVESSVKSKCALAEIDFMGVTAAIEDTCAVEITTHSMDHQVTSVGTVIYENLTFTPAIYTVSPNNGTALGGTMVILTGSHLLPYQCPHAPNSPPTVALSGVDCMVVNYNDTFIECMSGERRPEDVMISEIRVNVPGRGRAVVVDSAQFLYIDKWSSLTTWLNQEPPVKGDTVWLPAGQVVLLDQSTPELFFFLIEGDLYVDQTKDINVDAYYIYIRGGRFQMGTHEEPYEMNGVITLHGDRFKSIEIPHLGSKVLGVTDVGPKGMGSHPTGDHSEDDPYKRNKGILDIHGAVRTRTWTKIAETAFAGQDYVITSEDVDFKEGDRVILSGNGWYGEYDTPIVRETIDKRIVVFTEPLEQDFGSFWYDADGRVVDLRGEIGLLTRNIVIQGDSNSKGQQFGVHTIAVHGGEFRLENLELRHCGQFSNLGRYCSHSHHGMDMEGSYVKANSIHSSFQRAVTTHATHNWEVRDNVAFDIKGHAYFVEDGDELYNHITGNLGVFNYPSSALLTGDNMPAFFWTATPTNFWRDNVASHSVRGFWFELTGAVHAKCNPLGEFENMTFHSNSNIGLRIYPHWFPTVNADCSGASWPQYLYNMVSFHNAGNALFTKKMGKLTHVNATLLESIGSEVSIKMYKHVDYDSIPSLLGLKIVGSMFGTAPNKIGVIHPQDEYFYFKDVTWINYGYGGLSLIHI